MLSLRWTIVFSSNYNSLQEKYGCNSEFKGNSSQDKWLNINSRQIVEELRDKTIVKQSRSPSRKGKQVLNMAQLFFRLKRYQSHYFDHEEIGTLSQLMIRSHGSGSIEKRVKLEQLPKHTMMRICLIEHFSFLSVLRLERCCSLNIQICQRLNRVYDS